MSKVLLILLQCSSTSQLDNSIQLLLHNLYFILLFTKSKYSYKQLILTKYDIESGSLENTRLQLLHNSLQSAWVQLASQAFFTCPTSTNTDISNLFDQKYAWTQNFGQKICLDLFQQGLPRYIIHFVCDCVCVSVGNKFLGDVTRCYILLYDAVSLVLIVPLNCWRNSTPF